MAAQRGSKDDTMVAKRLELNPSFAEVVQTLSGGAAIELREQDDPEFVQLGEPDDLLP